MNQPYTREYEDGKLIPFHGCTTQFPNRRQRREEKNKTPFLGNGKNYPIMVAGKLKYKLVLQQEKDKEGNKKTIKHLILQ